MSEIAADDVQTDQPEAEVQVAEAETPETFDADYVRKLRAEAARYRTEAKQNAEKAKRLDEIEEASKSEQQRLSEAKEAAEKRAADLESRLLRSEVATEKGLPPALAARLTGATKEELEADADQLLTLVGKPAAGKASEALVGTRTPPAPTENPDDIAKRMKSRGLI